MFKPVGPPESGILNCLVPVALLDVLLLALVVAFSSGDLALADTVAIGAGGLGGGGGGGEGEGVEEDFHHHTSIHSIILTRYGSPLIVTCPSCSTL